MIKKMTASPISSVAYGAASIRSPLARGLGPSLELKPRASSSVGLLDDHDVDILIGITSMLLVLCIIAVGGRLLSRRMSRVHLEADDYLVVIALSLVIALSIEQFMLAAYGKNFSPVKVKSMTQLELASQLTYALLITTVKLSVLMLYRRVFSLQVRWFRIAWIANVSVAISIGLVLVILGVTGCSPHPLSRIVDMKGSCKKDTSSAAILGFMNAASDLLILLLPIRMCWSLQISRQQKFGLIGVFGLCLITIAVSIARASAIATGGISKRHGMALKFIIWSTTEPTVALICACLPPMRKLFTARIAKVSYVSPIRLDLRNPRPDESMSNVELSRANRNLANDSSVPPSRKSSMSSKMEDSRQSSMKDSRIEIAPSRDNFKETRLGHHVRMTESTDPDAYPSSQTQPRLKASETSQEVRSCLSESSSNTLSSRECDISSARSKQGVTIKKPG